MLQSAVRTHEYPCIKSVNALGIVWCSSDLMVCFFVPAFALFSGGRKHVFSYCIPKNFYIAPTISAVSILITSEYYKSKI